MTLQELKRQEQELKEALRQNYNKQKEVIWAEFEKETGIGFGDKISYLDKIGIVASAYVRGDRIESIRINLIKKDSTIGKNEFTIWRYLIQNVKVIEKAKK